MNRWIATPAPRRGALLVAVASLAAFLGWASPAKAMSADGSSYAVVLPWLFDTGFFRSRVAVENHSPSAVTLVAYWVGESTSGMPGQYLCSDAGANPVTQTFSFAVNADQVLQFDLGALLAEKCSPAGPAGAKLNRGTLTIMTPKGAGLALISATARVQAVAPSGTPQLGFSQRGIPLGALEGSQQLMAGLRSGKVASGMYRTDCLISSFADATQSGDLYTLRVKDSAGGVLGSLKFALSPWSSNMVTDVVKAVGAAGDHDGLQVEVEPGGNPTSPSMIASCRTVDGARPSFPTSLAIGKVYEPKDMQLRRSVRVDQTPGWGRFRFDPQAGRSFHVLFLRHPDLVTCVVSDPQLMLVVKDPDGNIVTGGFQSTGEFWTGVKNGTNLSGAWGLTVEVNGATPPSNAIDYEIRCVSGNGMSQIDRILP